MNLKRKLSCCLSMDKEGRQRRRKENMKTHELESFLCLESFYCFGSMYQFYQF